MQIFRLVNLVLVIAAWQSTRAASLVGAYDVDTSNPPQVSTENNLPAGKRAQEMFLSPEEQFDLAKKYLKGNGVAKDESRARALMTTAADLGNADAMGGMGFFYMKGIDVQKDEAMALDWFRKGAIGGSATAQCNLAASLLTHTDPASIREGMKWVNQAAEQGLPEALYIQGECFRTGEYEMPLDLKKAFSLFSQAAEAGHPGALYAAAAMLEKGEGVSPDPAKAEAWYRQAAIPGNTLAESSLGRLLSQSEEGSKRRESLFWLMVAAQKNETTAQKLFDQVSSDFTGKDLATACIETARYFRDRTVPKYF